MDNFASESSIGGVVVFHSSEPKKARIFWLFFYFLFFILLGFYVSVIFTRYKLEPEFSYKFSEFPLQEIPFPAVTICHPLFTRNQAVNLKKFLRNPNQNLTAEQQNLLAANLQACAPEMGSKIDKFCPLADDRKIVEVLKSKFLSVDDAFGRYLLLQGCVYNWVLITCSKILNYVLTDFGFCFTFNLDGFPTIFNTEIISDDFKCYLRDEKIAQHYFWRHPTFTKTINDANQTNQWNLPNGFLTKNRDTLPIRAFYFKNLQFKGAINNSDRSNLCSNTGRIFSIFLHMPNEILTPFHEPIERNHYHYLLNAKLFKVDESLRPFPPQKRNCYFEDERKLKFFKSYTKAQCQFECLANFTLAKCGCVKFSMPRENSTRICGLKETSCYIRVAKNWNLTCDCLHPCTYIEYGIEKGQGMMNWEKTKLANILNIIEFVISNFVIYSKKFHIINLYFLNIFGEKRETFGIYSIYQGWNF
jgi:acid-sensing ion channel, other